MNRARLPASWCQSRLCRVWDNDSGRRTRRAKAATCWTALARPLSRVTRITRPRRISHPVRGLRGRGGPLRRSRHQGRTCPRYETTCASSAVAPPTPIREIYARFVAHQRGSPERPGRESVRTVFRRSFKTFAGVLTHLPRNTRIEIHTVPDMKRKRQIHKPHANRLGASGIAGLDRYEAVLRAYLSRDHLRLGRLGKATHVAGVANPVAITVPLIGVGQRVAAVGLPNGKRIANTIAKQAAFELSRKRFCPASRRDME